MRIQPAPVPETVENAALLARAERGRARIFGARKYAPDQARDEAGRFALEGGGAVTPEQDAALKEFSGFGYALTNGVLRGQRMDPSLVDRAKKSVDVISGAMRPAALAMTLYRGMGAEAFTGTNDGAALEGFDWNAVVGKTFTDRGFVSTSSDKSVAETWDFKGALATVHAPAGTRAVAIRNPSNPGLKESEILLDKGLTFRVDKVSSAPDKFGGVTHVLDLSVIG